jgi:hypothetical protein
MAIEVNIGRGKRVSVQANSKLQVEIFAGAGALPDEGK